MQGLTNTNSAINSNRQMYERLSKNSALTSKPSLHYLSSEVQYYNDEKAIKKQRRKKLAKWLTLGFAGTSILAIGATLAISAFKGKHKDLIRAIKAHAQGLDLKLLGIDEEAINNKKASYCGFLP